MTTLGIIFVCIMVAIPFLFVFLAISAEVEGAAIPAFIFGIGFSLTIFCISGAVSSANAETQYEKDFVPKHRLIIEKLEYQCVIHIKNDIGIVIQSIVANNVKDYELVKSDNFYIAASYAIDMYGFKFSQGYVIIPRENVEKI